MDLSSAEHQLASSDLQKPDSNPSNARCYIVEKFIADVRFIFSSALAFNGNEHPVYLMCQLAEEVFDNLIKQMPSPGQVLSSR